MDLQVGLKEVLWCFNWYSRTQTSSVHRLTFLPKGVLCLSLPSPVDTPQALAGSRQWNWVLALVCMCVCILFSSSSCCGELPIDRFHWLYHCDCDLSESIARGFCSFFPTVIVFVSTHVPVLFLQTEIIVIYDRAVFFYFCVSDCTLIRRLLVLRSTRFLMWNVYRECVNCKVNLEQRKESKLIN